jgi:phage FluMu protein Com
MDQRGEDLGEMELFMIYCTRCNKVIGEAYAKEDSGVAKGEIKDEYYCSLCAKVAAREAGWATAWEEPDGTL